MSVGGSVCLLALLLESINHWFLIPITLLGALLAPRLGDAWHGRIDPLRADVLLTLLMLHNFVAAPILHIAWDTYVPYVPGPSQEVWLNWFGYMAVVNVLGVASFGFAFRLAGLGRGGTAGILTTAPIQSSLDWRATLPKPAAAFIALGIIMQIAVYARFGGLLGFAEAATSIGSDRGELAGLGLVLVIPESVPIIVSLLWVSSKGRFRPGSRLGGLFLYVTAIGAVSLGFGGLRQSRANLLFSVLLCVLFYHRGVRRVRLREIAAFLLAGLLFLYVGSFYKVLGTDAAPLVFSGELEYLETETSRGWQSTVLHDLARADVQAMVLAHTTESAYGYRFGYGRTYVGALALLVPARIWPDRPETKRVEGTNALYGAYAYEAGLLSPRVYGLSGEALLNFGPLAVPVVMFMFGTLVRRIAIFSDAALAREEDELSVRDIVSVFLGVSVLVIFLQDSNNVLLYFVRIGLPLAAVVGVSLMGATRRMGTRL